MHHRATRPRAKADAADPRPLLVAVFALAALAMAATLAAPPKADALVLRRSVEQMSAEASSVVLADVVSVQSQKVTQAGHVGISTVVRLTSVETLKGAGRRTFSIRLPGGSVGGLRLYVPEMPTFVAGQRTVLFLDGTDFVVAGRQGSLSVSNGQVPQLGQSYGTVRTRVRRAARLTGGEAAALGDAGTAASGVSVLGLGPVIDSVDPTSASVGTGLDSRVTITGSGFGATQGAVTFYYDGSTQITATTIVSWTDTQTTLEVPAYMIDGYPASAGSGPMVVWDAAGNPSAPYDFGVTFSYGGVKWTPARVPYYRCPSLSGLPNGAAAIDAAARTWTPASDFVLGLAGVTAEPPSDPWWGPPWPASDGKNEVYADTLPSGYLGLTFTWFSSSGIEECDYAINADAPPGTAWGDGSGMTFDVQSVAVHEFGHWLGFNDLYGAGDSGKIMYGYGGHSEVKRTLSPADEAGALWIYGPPSPDGTAPISASDAGGPYTALATVHITATDEGRGVQYVSYRLDAGDTVTVPAAATAVQTSIVGNHSLVFLATDWTGNVESPAHEVTFTVLPAPPPPPPPYVPPPAPTLPALPGHAFSPSYPLAPSTAYYGRTFTIYGYLKPRHTAGAYSVRLEGYRYERQSNGTYKWVRRATWYAKNYNYSSYTKYAYAANIKLRGRWRVRPVHTHTGYLPKYGNYRYLTVK